MTIGSTSYENQDLGDSKEARFYLSGPLIADRLGLALYGSLHDRNKPAMEYESRGTVATQQQDRRNASLGGRLTLGDRRSPGPEPGNRLERERDQPGIGLRFDPAGSRPTA